MYINKIDVKNNNGGIMKKLCILLVIILFLFSNNIEKTGSVFLFAEDEVYDNYIMKFDECELNTNNFIEKLEYFYNKDFKILEIIPYHDLDNKFLFYTDDLNYIYNKIKNDYLNIMIENSSYVTNMCIKEIKINTSNYILDEYKNIINFSY